MIAKQFNWLGDCHAYFMQILPDIWWFRCLLLLVSLSSSDGEVHAKWLAFEIHEISSSNCHQLRWKNIWRDRRWRRQCRWRESTDKNGCFQSRPRAQCEANVNSTTLCKTETAQMRARSLTFVTVNWSTISMRSCARSTRPQSPAMTVHFKCPVLIFRRL